MRPSDIITTLAILTPLLVGCYGTPELRTNLSDNVIDKYLEPSAPYPYEQRPELIERFLEKSFPIGSPTAEIVGYLRSIGASCDMQGVGKTKCRYEKYVESVVTDYILLLGITVDREGYRSTYVISVGISSLAERISGLVVDINTSRSRI